MENIESIEQEFEDYKAQTEEYKQYLELELLSKEETLSGIHEKSEGLLSSLQSLRQKYTSKERDYVSLQQEKELLQSELSVCKSQKRDVEHHNDNLEQLTRVMEFTSQDFREKLNQAEETAFLISEELEFVKETKTTEIERLFQKRENLKRQIESAQIATVQVSVSTETDNNLHFNPNTRSIRVLARVRPLFPNEKEGGEVFGSNILLRSLKKTFAFEKVLPQTTQTQDVFFEIRDSLECAMRGGRACVLAYGQTGSGKTHTMNGLMRQSVFYMSKHLPQSSVKISCIEIYNELTRNLLTAGELKKNWKEVIAPVDLSENWEEQVIESIQKAQQNRAVKTTRSNELSSRSHAIYSIYIGSGQIQFVDLAGSERLANSQTKGVVLKETLMINKSLSALQDVIAALDNKQTHIPYRNSTLTQVLQSTLGGTESMVTVILNCSLAEKHCPETACTLALGTRLKTIDLSFKLRQDRNAQEVDRTLAMLEKEKAEKNAMLRKIDKLERELENYCKIVKDREEKVNAIQVKINKKEKEHREQAECLWKSLIVVKGKAEEANKKVKVLKTQNDSEKHITRRNTRRSALPKVRSPQFAMRLDLKKF